MNTLSCRCGTVVFGFWLFFSAGQVARANVEVVSTSSFESISIDPTTGTVNYIGTLQSSAFSQAGANAQYNSSPAASTAGSSDVPVTGGAATGAGTASASALTGSSSATGSIPGAAAGFDTSTGRASLNSMFSISGSGSVSVTFSVLINGTLILSSDAYGVYGQGETDFALTVNGNPVLFNDLIMSVGPNQFQSGGGSETLTGTMTLTAGNNYYLWAEADSEAMVVNSSTSAVPDTDVGLGLTGCLWGLLLVVALGRQRTAFKTTNFRFFLLLAGAMVGLAVPGHATYIGSDASDVCLTCGIQATRQQAGGISTSWSEGNMRDNYSVVTVTSGYGDALTFGLTYNSYNADGSKAQLDTGMGFGWTHTYNALLFQQRGQMFRLGADGRVTQYYMNFSGTSGTYTSDTGYFETLTMQADGSFIVTNKNQSWWHFGLVPNTPFLVAGPVYRLLQMGDRNGNINTMSYNAGGLLVSVTDPFGRTLQFGYNPSNKLSSITDPLGRITTLQYDPLGRVPIQITDPLGNSVKYTYNSQYQITRKVDRDGRMYFYMYKGLRPFAVTDANGQPWFSMANPTDWAVNQTYLAFSLRRQYVPSITANLDGNGNLWSYQYDTNGYITQVTAPDGAVTAYSYDATTLLLSSMTDANGNATHYQYDAEGNRTKLTDALGEVTTYTYEPVFNQMTSMTDPNGRTTTYQYDTRGNEIREIDPLNQTNSWTYDGHGNVSSFTDKNGNTVNYQYDAYGNVAKMTDPLGNVTTYTYDPIGNRLSITDPLGRTTRYQYDPLDRLTGTTNALNGVTRSAYDPLGRQLSVTDPNTNTTAYLYDLRGRVIQTTDAQGGVIQYGYDPNNNRIAATNQLGHPTTSTYDAQNRLTGTTNAIGGVTRYTYDPVGNRISSTDPNTNTTHYAYDVLNRMAATTNALGGVTKYDYSMPGGPPCCSPTPGSSLLTRLQDADGNVTFYHYDELNRRVQVVRKNSDTNDVINPADAVTTTAYDPVGNVIAVTDPNTNTTAYMFDEDNRQVSMVNAAGDTTLTTYDGDGNVLAVTAPNNNTTTNIYDSLNRVIFVYDEIGLVVSNTYDADGNRLTTTDPLGHATTDRYDALNRQIQVIDPLGQTTTTAYDPDSNVISMTDRNGHTTTYFYDGLDRCTSVTDALGNATVTTYDPDSSVIGLTDANGHTSRFGYDALNRQVTETYPDAPPNTRYNFYDPVGNLISRVDQKGEVTTCSYNDLYYLTNRAYLPSGADDALTYDNGGRMLSGNRNGWVVTFAYDGAGRVTNTVQNGRVLTYTYNIPGRVETNTQPSGRTLNYTYDARNRLVTIQDGTPNPPIVTYFYDGADRVVTRTYRNGTTAAYTYNANDWVTSLEHSNATSRIAGFGYAYDNEGNRLFEQKRDNPPDSEAYAYDAIDRLTNYDVGTLSGSVIPAPVIAKTWNLDPLGNWNSVVSNGVPQVRTHGPANELLTANASSFSYDFNGNLSNDTANIYVYDEENRLTQVQRVSDSAIVGRYYYDALDRRVAQVVNPAGTVSTNYYFYDENRIIEEQNPAGATVATYTYGNYLDEVLTMERGGQIYYYHPNALWNVEALSDASGNATERYTYDAYGGVTVLDGSYAPLALNAWGTPHSAVANSFLFTGRELDEETGIYEYRNRYYDSNKGRFLQRDPMDYDEEMNLYEYAKGDPMLFTDPYGEDADEIVVKLEKSKENLKFQGSKTSKDRLTLEFPGSGFPSVSGEAKSVKKVKKQDDVENEGEYLLRYLEGVTLTLTPDKTDQNKMSIEQTGSARFINFCYHAKGKPGQCTRQANTSAFLDGSFNLVSLKQDPKDAKGAAVFNLELPVNLTLVGGKLVNAAPFKERRAGYVTLTVHLGKDTDLCKLLGKDEGKEVPIESGEVKITPGK
jgi:RHS repeat-associated protein